MNTTRQLVKACEAAVRCLESIERNDKYIEKSDPGAAGAWVSTVEGWKRNLEHSRDALAAAKGE